MVPAMFVVTEAEAAAIRAVYEDRGGMCTLLAFVDEATSRLMQLRFVASESAFDYFRVTRSYLETHGKPVVHTITTGVVRAACGFR